MTVAAHTPLKERYLTACQAHIDAAGTPVHWDAKRGTLHATHLCGHTAGTPITSDTIADCDLTTANPCAGSAPGSTLLADLSTALRLRAMVEPVTAMLSGPEPFSPAPMHDQPLQTLVITARRRAFEGIDAPDPHALGLAVAGHALTALLDSYRLRPDLPATIVLDTTWTGFPSWPARIQLLLARDRPRRLPHGLVLINRAVADLVDPAVLAEHSVELEEPLTGPQKALLRQTFTRPLRRENLQSVIAATR